MTHFSNIDLKEKLKFNEIANEWWDKNGPMKPLHAINPTRLKFIQQSYPSLKGLKILDIGCGGGLLSEALAQEGAEVTGLDISEELIRVANHHSQQQNLNIQYVCSAIENLSADHRQTFDIIVCMELLEHVPDPEQLLRVSLNYLKPEGSLYLSTINRTLKSYFLGILVSEYLLGLLPKDTHHYEKLIKPSELDRILRELQCYISRLSGIAYNPLSNNASLQKDLSINYILEAKML